MTAQISKTTLTQEQFNVAQRAIGRLVHRQADRKRAGEPLDEEAQKTIDAWEEACAIHPRNYQERTDRLGMLFDIARTRGLL